MSNKKKVVIVDDNVSILDSIQLMLDFEGFEVIKFSKGSDMLKLMNRNTKPHIILMDMWLSGEDGRDICKILKNEDDLKDIPVIIMSASREMGKSAKEAGATDFISKPFDLVEMLDKINKYTES